MATYTPRTWADAELADIGAPVTANTEQTLVDWAAAEGGAGPEWGIPNNVTDYNPINISLTSGAKGYGYDPGTGQFWPGAHPTPGNTPPIAAFSDWTTGLEATAARLEEPFAGSILADLRSNAPEAVTASAVARSGWGTGDFAGIHAPGTASGSGPTSSSSPGAAATNAQLAGLNANPFDLFGIPQTIAGTAASALWSEVGPFIVKALLAITGLGVIVLGVAKTTDAGQKVKEEAPRIKEAAAAAPEAAAA